jgi:hypothetical protein
MTTRIIDVHDFFIHFLPEKLPSRPSSYWFVCRDLIRLPPIEELSMSSSFAWEYDDDEEEEEEDEEHGKNDNCKNSREK